MSWIAGALELIAKWLVGNKNRYGYLLHILSGLVWLIVAIQVPEARGLMIVVFPALIINARNFRKWGIEDSKKPL